MKRTIFFCLIISFIFTHAQSWNQIIKLTASDRAFAASFGVSVSVSGDYAVIGAKSENYDASGSNYLSEAGAAYVFKLENGNWVQKQKIVASDRAESVYFGQSVSIENDYIVVGAYNEGSAYPLQNAGAVYVFQLDNGSWVQKQKLVASERAGGAYFGNSVSIKNSKIFIGAINEKKDASGANSLNGAGAVYIFGLNSGTWQQQQKIVNSDRLSLSGGIQFGYNLDTDGNYLVVSTPNKSVVIEGEELGNAGAAYIFENQNESWIEKQIIYAADPDSNMFFGNSIAISGDYIVAGAHNEQSYNPGAAYIFKKNNNVWSQYQRLS
ncbi:MAG: hypothetical protein DI529_12715 [Chryseobacterium sp.]|nr:MAG: hypothetical protein DI529_12715 [Chryseobacterium sp.]